jgi:myo-inositol 2-dehydrogenase / D-chiro-inositol 1-dehydrogenase
MTLNQNTVLPGARAAGSDEIKVGLLGCGGRGTGAAINAVEAAEGVRIVAMADAFQDRLDQSRKILTERAGAKMSVTDETCFVGLDAYKRILEADINYVVMATPPGFRPEHIKAAVAAGKHIFAEKPVAVDGAGIRSCLESHDEIAKKGLGLVAGTLYRHHTGYLESIKRIHDGQIGDIGAAWGWYNTTGLWKHDRQPAWSDLEYQMRNWLYYTWLSGDHVVEQAVHNIDALNWIMGANPVRAIATGGRQTRTAPEYGHIYDHFAIEYEYPGETRVFMMCRQQDGCDKKVANEVVGTKGRAFILPQFFITGEKPWKLEGEINDAYVAEHTNLINSIRAGKPLNEMKQIAESTLVAILGRDAAYSGGAVTWEEALASPSLLPPKLEWGPMPVPPVPMPGQSSV